MPKWETSGAPGEPEWQVEQADRCGITELRDFLGGICGITGVFDGIIPEWNGIFPHPILGTKEVGVTADLFVFIHSRRLIANRGGIFNRRKCKATLKGQLTFETILPQFVLWLKCYTKRSICRAFIKRYPWVGISGRSQSDQNSNVTLRIF